MRNLDHHTITAEVIRRFSDTPEPRLKEIVTALVQHLHDFAREVKLTEAEWAKGIAFLTATGQMCNEERQEFILLSDVLGLSMLTVAMNNDKPPGCTEATVFGPFFVEGAPSYDHGADVANGAAGEPCEVYGAVRALDGTPIADAVIDVWQADAEGLYDVQRSDRDRAQGRGVLRSGADGHFHFRTVVAEPYPIPTDGPVGQLLEATRRHPWRPAHLHFKIEAAGHAPLVTHIFREGDRWLDSDAVFGVRQSLVVAWRRQPNGTWRMDYDFVLAPSQATSTSKGT